MTLPTELHNSIVRFLAHDVWNRVYAGDDLYQWFLQYQKGGIDTP